MPPELIIGLRHGEKPANAEENAPLDDQGPGIDLEGDQDSSSLTLRGWQRAGALAGTWLCGRLDPAPRDVTIAVPSYDHSDRHRAFQTVMALAARLGTEPQPWVGAADVGDLSEKVLASTGTLVVCWEHDALAKLGRKLTGDDALDWPHGRFDVLWLFHPAGGETFTCEQRDQCLLADDVC